MKVLLTLEKQAVFSFGCSCLLPVTIYTLWQNPTPCPHSEYLVFCEKQCHTPEDVTANYNPRCTVCHHRNDSLRSLLLQHLLWDNSLSAHMKLKKNLPCSDIFPHFNYSKSLFPWLLVRYLVIMRKGTTEEWKWKINMAHQFILVRSLLCVLLFFLLHHQPLIQVTDDEWWVIPVPQSLIHIRLDSAEHLNAFVSYKTLLDVFVKWLFHWYFFAFHKEILINFTN